MAAIISAASCAPALAITVGTISTATGSAVVTASTSPLTLKWNRISPVLISQVKAGLQVGTIDVSGFDAKTDGFTIAASDPINQGSLGGYFINGTESYLGTLPQYSVNGGALQAIPLTGVIKTGISGVSDKVNIPVVLGATGRAAIAGDYTATYTITQNIK